MSNVTTHPAVGHNRLKEIGSQIESYAEKSDAARDAWADAMVEIAVLTYEARKMMPENQNFGHWFSDLNTSFNKNDRAGLVKIGANRKAAEVLFGETGRTSVGGMAREGEIADVLSRFETASDPEPSSATAEHAEIGATSQNTAESTPEAAVSVSEAALQVGQMLDGDAEPEEAEAQPEKAAPAPQQEDDLRAAIKAFFQKDRSTPTHTTIFKFAPELAGKGKKAQASDDLRDIILDAVLAGEWVYSGIGPGATEFDLRMAFPFLPKPFADSFSSKYKTPLQLMAEIEKLTVLNNLCKDNSTFSVEKQKPFGTMLFRSDEEEHEISQHAHMYWQTGNWTTHFQLAKQKKEAAIEEAKKHPDAVVFYGKLIYDPSKDAAADQGAMQAACWAMDNMIKEFAVPDYTGKPKSGNGIAQVIAFIIKDLEQFDASRPVTKIMRKINSALRDAEKADFNQHIMPARILNAEE